jgi:hypothetical protein
MSGLKEARMLRSRSWLSPALLALALGAAGCAENEVSLSIRQIQVPQPGGTSGICTVSSDPSSAASFLGVLDVAVRFNYTVSPLFQNELICTRAPTDFRPEVRDIVVNRVDVELHRDSVDGPIINVGGVTGLFTLDTPAHVPCTGTSGAGFGVGGFDVITSRIGRALFDQVCVLGPPPVPGGRPSITSNDVRLVARIVPFGRTMGGIAVQGAPFIYPIQVCCGCLLRFPSDADDPMHHGPDCSQGTPMTQVCDQGQDVPLDCRFCAGSNPLCQPPGFMP